MNCHSPHMKTRSQGTKTSSKTIRHSVRLRGAGLGIIEFPFFAVGPGHRLHAQKFDPRGIEGHGKGQGIVLVFLAVGPAGQAEGSLAQGVALICTLAPRTTMPSFCRSTILR